MSNVHVASAANEVAQALPSTATVTVSKHGIQAIETLNLDAQSASDKSLTWSRTFSGMEILTNPILQYRTLTTFQSENVSGFGSYHGALASTHRAIKEHIRPRCDPIANAASSINVTINNASMAIQPARDHRIVNTTYPDEAVVANQRQHYGLNQLDTYAEPAERTFGIPTFDDVERQHNANSLRDNYPSRLYVGELAGGGAIDPQSDWRLVEPKDYYLVVEVTGANLQSNTEYHLRLPGSRTSSNTAYQSALGKFERFGDDLTELNNGESTYYVVRNIDTDDPIRGYNALAYENLKAQLTTSADVATAAAASDEAVQGTAKLPAVLNVYDTGSGVLRTIERSVTLHAMLLSPTFDPDSQTSNITIPEYYAFGVVYDISQPLAHPYFRDNVMRDNTLVNARYFDCQITISDVGKLIEAAPLQNTLSSDNGASSNLQLGPNTQYTTTLFLSGQSIGTGTASKGSTPRLIFDLVTPSVPLPTISDKVVSTFHTMTSSSVSSLPVKDLKSGNIQLSQIPDKIYVFCKSDLMESKAKTLQTLPATRLGVCTKLRIRTPQNSAFLIEMDQESLYQMSVRNGSKQSRSSFMCTLGSVVCIDPEKDLGGYTNGVLLPYTFDVQADFAKPCASGTDSIVWRSDIDTPVAGAQPTTASENWTLFVVCELHGHLYLMSDGTGKQTKSNLTVTEVADAVAEGLQHPSTLGNQARSQKMDAGVLAEVSRAGETRDALRG